jgi:hypothetical protein
MRSTVTAVESILACIGHAERTGKPHARGTQTGPFADNSRCPQIVIVN